MPWRRPALDDEITAHGGGPAPGDGPPGLREQIGRVKDAGMGLVKAHIELAKAELGDILDEVKGVAVLAGGAVGCLLFVAVLVPVGTALFLGEWLFGSIGWGVLLGAEGAVAVAVILGLGALGLRAGTVVGALVVAILAGLIVGTVLGLDLTNRGWTLLADQLDLAIQPAWEILAVAVVTSAIVLGILLAIVGVATAGGGGLIGGLIGGAILGALLGAFTAITFGPRVGAAIGVFVAFLVWPALAGLRVVRDGIDVEALKARFWPSATIETTKETIEWVRERTPLGPRS